MSTHIKLKILCIIERSSWDGAKEQTYLFIREMSKHHDVELAINEKFTRMSELAKPLVKVRYFEKYSKVKMQFNFNNYARLLKIINQNHYDLVITQSSLTMQYVRAIYPFIKKKPKVIAVKRGDTIPNFFSRVFKYSLADEIVLVSKHVKEELEKNNSHKQHMHVIESGIDMARFYPGKDITGVRKKLGIKTEDKVYINVSNWDLNRKRQQIILQAFSELECKNCKLLLVGNGTDSPEALNTIKSFGISDRVICLGFRKDVPDLLRASDYFVMSSNSEGIAGALLQAMACGKIVLSTNAGGIREYLHDGVNGYSSAVNDIALFNQKFSALHTISQSTKNSLATSAIKTAHNYSLDKNIKQWLKLISQLAY